MFFFYIIIIFINKRSEQEIIAEIEPIKKVEENEIPEMIQPEDMSEKNNITILDKNELSSLDKQSYFKISYDEQVIPACIFLQIVSLNFLTSLKKCKRIKKPIFFQKKKILIKKSSLATSSLKN